MDARLKELWERCDRIAAEHAEIRRKLDARQWWRAHEPAPDRTLRAAFIAPDDEAEKFAGA